jgi:hypothetical protein
MLPELGDPSSWAVRWGALMRRALKRVPLGTLGQGHVIWESIGLISHVRKVSILIIWRRDRRFDIVKVREGLDPG